MSAEYFVVRRAGRLWAAPGDRVREVERDGRGVRLRLVAGGTLEVDEVAGVTRALAVRAVGAVVEACWNETAQGLAVFAGEPCVVIDPDAPPRALRGRGTEGEGEA